MLLLKFVGKFLIYLVLTLISIFVIAYFAINPDTQIAMTAEYDDSIEAIQIDSSFFHSESYGITGDPVLIIVHGGPGFDFKNLLPLKALADSSNYVIFYDQRGSGLSPRVNPEEISIASSLADLDSVVENYRSDNKVNILGHGWGAALATEYTANNLEKVNKLILAESIYLKPEIAESRKQETAPGTASEVSNLFTMFTLFMEALHVKTPDDQAWMDYLLYKMMTIDISNNNPVSKYFCDSLNTDYFNVWRMGSFSNQRIMSEIVNEGNYVHDFSVGIENFSGETLIISSECNQVFGFDTQKEHESLFQNVDHVLIKDSGHLMFSEQTDTCLTLINDFLKSTSE